MTRKRKSKINRKEHYSRLLFAYLVIIFLVITIPSLRESAIRVFSFQLSEKAAIGDMGIMGAGNGSIFGVGSTPKASTSVPAETAGSCQGITQVITAGSSDSSTRGQVSLLQDFLAKDKTLYPEGLVTGFVGPATVRAIQRYQVKEGLSKVGDPAFGIAGPETRAKFTKAICSTDNTWLSSIRMPIARDGITIGLAVPNTGNTTKEEKIDLPVFSNSKYRNASSTANGKPILPPRILGVLGPRSVGLGKIATWTVQAASDDGNPVSYGVYWGDQLGGGITSSNLPLAQSNYPTFSNVFVKVGTYELIFAAKNKGGTAYQSVFVSTGNAPFFGGKVSFDVRDGSITCETMLGVCNRLGYGSGKLERYIDDGNTAIYIGESNVNKGFISWSSLPAGQYRAVITVAGYRPFEQKFSLTKKQEKLVKVMLESTIAKKPLLLRVTPEAGIVGDFVTVTGNNLTPATKVYFEKKFLGYLETKNGAFGFTVPAAVGNEPECVNDLITSSGCIRSSIYTLKPGIYNVILGNAAGTTSPQRFQLFQKSTVQEFNPAIMEQQYLNRIRGGSTGGGGLLNY